MFEPPLLVIALIAALDHPMNKFISIPQQPLVSLQSEMKSTPPPVDSGQQK
jgi:hypothetical protein